MSSAAEIVAAVPSQCHSGPNTAAWLLDWFGDRNVVVASEIGGRRDVVAREVS